MKALRRFLVETAVYNFKYRWSGRSLVRQLNTTSNMAPMTAAQIAAYPEYPHVIWKLKPRREGLVPVAKGRGGPFNISYKVHGNGPRLIVLIMGLGGTQTSWQRQVKDFGHTEGDRYSVLVFDNRGIGASDKPRIRYSTNEMAKDTLEIIDHIGWKEPRSLNVLGVSMGGMIAQELGAMIPERIATLTLLSTAAQIINTVGFWANLKQRAQMFAPRTFDTIISNAKSNLYTRDFLDKPDELEYTVKPYPTNGDRFAAAELTKRSNPANFTRLGFIAQAIAAGWHKKTKPQLQKMATDIGRERIMVIHGTEDRMISVPHAQTLAEGLSGDNEEVQTIIWEKQGHVIPVEKRKEFHKVFADKIERFYKP